MHFSLSFFLFLWYDDHRYLHSFPTRRSSDLENVRVFPISNWTELDVWNYLKREKIILPEIYYSHLRTCVLRKNKLLAYSEDRKSTRLNSSHVRISYAVFCLKKKKNKSNVLTQ